MTSDSRGGKPLTAAKVKKPTPAQRKVLEKIAEGWALEWHSGTRLNSWWWLRLAPAKTAKVNPIIGRALRMTPWIVRESTENDWRMSRYVLTPSGRSALSPTPTSSEGAPR